jgi:hypothetical protein
MPGFHNSPFIHTHRKPFLKKYGMLLVCDPNIMLNRFLASTLLFFLATATLRANPPVASYIFPAGGQRGSTVKVRVGGLFLYDKCGFEIIGNGVKGPEFLTKTKTVWFEGSLLPLPDSQRQEDYPRDMAGQIQIGKDAAPGLSYWRLWTSQGATPAMKFMVGDVPEIVEDEIDGDPVPVKVTLPVTINGRIFPREDVDIWTVQAKKGQAITCEVHAARLGSPLDARLEIRDAAGRRLAENEISKGGDPLAKFTAPADGEYQVRIHDVRFQGGQAYVYRLTLTADPYVERFFPLGGKRGSTIKLELAGQGVPESVAVALPNVPGSEFLYQPSLGARARTGLLLELDDLPEYLKPEKAVSLPAIFNGRVDKPGNVDSWTWTAKKGQAFVFDLRAARLGSPLDGVLSIQDGSGKELARGESGPGQPDGMVTFNVPADGTYSVQVRDRFRSRGGPEFSYRLRVDRPPSGDFQLSFPTDAVTVNRKGVGKLRINVQRQGKLNEAIALKVDGLPAGVAVSGTTVPSGQNGADLVFKADDKAAVGISRLTITGTAKVDKKVDVTRKAKLVVPRGAPDLDNILLSVALPTPFKIKGEYIMGFAPRGTIHKRKYKIERGGYTGPIVISLADKQARHLQGAYGPNIVVPPGANEFTYDVTLPPWMETGRTSRVCVMGVGVIKEPDGKEHQVSFSSVNQNEQLVAVVGPGKLALEVERTTVALQPGKMMFVPVRIKRGQGVEGDVKLELVVPEHIKGLTGEPATIAKGKEEGRLAIRCADNARGPFNMPVIVRATLVHEGQPVVAEGKVEILPD